MAWLDRQRALDLFVGRRMVLDLPCGAGNWLEDFAARRIPAVGVDPSPASVRAVRARALPAFVGGWDVLERRPGSVDAVRCGWTAQADQDRGLRALRSVLRAGGVAVFVGDALPDPSAVEAAGFGHRFRGEFRDEASGGRARICVVVRATDEVVAEAPWPAPVVGPYADAFAGLERVLELGVGTGRFLDALHVRGVGAGVLGIEGSRERVRCRAPGTVLEGDSEVAVARILGRRGGFDGVYVDRVHACSEGEDLEVLLSIVRDALAREGVAILRHSRTWAEEAEARARALQLGLAVEPRAFSRDAEDAYWLVRHGDAVDRVGEGAEHDRRRVLASVAAPLGRPVDAPFRGFDDLERFEARVYSQCGDDGVLAKVFETVGLTDRFFVEFGCGDGSECNARRLRDEDGWRGVWMDGAVPDDHPDVHREWISAENIRELFDRHGVPEDTFDLMSIDLDGNDYWVWKALPHRPRVVVAEYNANFGKDRAVTIPADPTHAWDGTDHFGASLAALDQLAAGKGYTLVYCNQTGVNAVFVRDDVLPRGFVRRAARDLFQPCNFFYRGYQQVPNFERPLVEVGGRGR